MSDLTTVSPWDCFVKHPFEVMFNYEVEEATSVYLNGGHDDTALSIHENGWHVFRVGAIVIASDEMGFDYGYHYADEQHAVDVMDALHEVEDQEDELPD